jgi:hypothetical protein
VAQAERIGTIELVITSNGESYPRLGGGGGGGRANDRDWNELGSMVK